MKDGVRGDIGAHEHAMEIPIEVVVRELVALLGATTVAVVGGVRETRAVTQWLSGRAPQRPHVLRFALQLGLMIANEANNEIARAWFHGSNPQLGDAIPMMLLRDGELRDIQSPLLAAARSFAARA